MAYNVVRQRFAKAAFVSCICTAAKSATVQMQEIDEKRLRLGVHQ
ncbi:MAG: hypothetical protein R3357_03525 [Burkholderiales bacterium]|nr:hypothetical protein [Burkholderiales bacterium]